MVLGKSNYGLREVDDLQMTRSIRVRKDCLQYDKKKRKRIEGAIRKLFRRIYAERTYDSGLDSLFANRMDCWPCRFGGSDTHYFYL